ncbi:serine/threonine protein phosphatase [Afifella sp. JA880]|uniref:metallophosphoesterase family protein n=1 Tax=Afifella sp. JA880 TaxID=2975280 RepID=UPI0021BAAB65|nr:metallophosphoesterase family protein [Afifella sp. JA880]MCT8267401.1 serine/threonine protein phosphatase [Afifella sp. JA880]
MAFFSAARTDPQHAVPDGCRVYAIGDIHGRFDLLLDLQEQIKADLAASPPEESVEIFLGDYIDRGPNSRAVLEYLFAGEKLCDRRVCLKGNHEAVLLEVLSDPSMLPYWCGQGGSATLRSFGVAPPSGGDQRSLVTCHQALLQALSGGFEQFLRSLALSESVGDYFFVHAGIDPRRPMRAQREEDLVWIREPFLSSGRDFGFCVVHGHTPRDEVDIRPNRIDIDTRAFASGRLTCLVLEGGERRFLQTQDIAEPEAVRRR